MKRIFFLISIIILISSSLYSQKINWQQSDLKTDSLFGISSERAYSELLKDKKPTPVIVAVIDSGIDTTHEDLKQILWKNPKEIPDNGKDDDGNGYIDDINGWNFIGFERGKDDVTNLAGTKKNFYDSLSYIAIPEVYRAGYQENRKKVKEFQNHVNNAKNMLWELDKQKKIVENLVKQIGKNNPSIFDFKNFQVSTEDEKKVKDIIIKYLPYYHDFNQYKKYEIDSQLYLMQYHINHGLNLDDTSQSILDKGNNNVMGVFTLFPFPGPYHGTHVAGIIGAVRRNGIGVDGIADHVSIMSLKVLSSFRELRDYNLAQAIIYAVDNGAKVINLSFGKFYTWDKHLVDSAVEYAMKRDVLIIHAAGNDGLDIDVNTIYPNSKYENGSVAPAWIEVGASSTHDDSTLVASFSNYGKTTVDVFAPGVQIYSSIPGSTYEAQNGTSMAAPVVSGLAAMIREYYPALTATQVKEIILKSVTKVTHDVIIKDLKGQTKTISFAEVCASSGIVNAHNAIQLAALYN